MTILGFTSTSILAALTVFYIFDAIVRWRKKKKKGKEVLVWCMIEDVELLTKIKMLKNKHGMIEEIDSILQHENMED